MNKIEAESEKNDNQDKNKFKKKEIKIGHSRNTSNVTSVMNNFA